MRVATGARRLVALITAIPACVRADATPLRTVEINFLCVHKKLRHKRLAPVLIKEITRRVNLEGIWQAVYTAGVLLPKPVAECQYWHRSLNPKKLISVGFRWAEGGGGWAGGWAGGLGGSEATAGRSVWDRCCSGCSRALPCAK